MFIGESLCLISGTLLCPHHDTSQKTECVIRLHCNSDLEELKLPPLHNSDEQVNDNMLNFKSSVKQTFGDKSTNTFDSINFNRNSSEFIQEFHVRGIFPYVDFEVGHAKFCRNSANVTISLDQIYV